MTARVDIIIVNWNAGTQLRDCVDSVIQHGHSVVSKIIIVDNGSTDGSDRSIHGLPNVTLILAGENLGFGKACNQGAELASSEYLLFLNPDTRFFKHSLSAPLSFMQCPENADVGICGIQLIDEAGHVSRSCYRFPTLGRLVAQATGLDKLPGLKHVGQHMQEWDHLASREVDHVIGAFFLVRRDLFETLGGFDERFFVYFEEVDLSFRARKAGWKSFYFTEAQAFHEGGGTTSQIKATRLFYSLRSRLLYGFKHFKPWQAWALLGVTLVVEPVSRVTLCLMRGDGRGAVDTLQGFRLLWGELREIYRITRESRGIVEK